MKRIILLCAAGMSTSYLVEKMRIAAASKNYLAEIYAYTVNDLDKCVDADIILVGPQVRFKQPMIQKEFPEKPVKVIDMRDYGMMDGEAIILQVIETIGE